MEKFKVLIVDDEPDFLEAIITRLKAREVEVAGAESGYKALELLDRQDFDVIILDIMLPKKNGLDVCRSLRNDHVNTPILMLTARDALEDRVAGLDSGADDYLVKPFALEELRARLRALLRRESSNRNSRVGVDELTLDPATHYVQRDSTLVELTSKEYSLLEYMMRNPNRLITREMAESHVWSYDYDGASNVVDVYIRRLRRKIDDPYPRKLIETVRGAGYRLRAQAG